MRIPHWDALNYLESLSEKFTKGEETAYIPAVIQIIRNISLEPVDNYITWYRLVNILANIPTDHIPEDILSFLPVWVSSNYDTSTTTHALVEKLLPKFITEQAGTEDQGKALLILQQLFTLKRKEELSNGNRAEARNYYTPYAIYHLKHGLLDPKITARFNQQLAPRHLELLARQLNELLRDRQLFIELPDGSADKEVLSIVSIYGRLEVSLTRQTAQGTASLYNDVLEDYCNRLPELRTVYFKNLLDSWQLSKDVVNDAEAKINFFLSNDLESHIGYSPISDLQDNHSMNAVLSTFAYIYRDWLKSFALAKPEAAAAYMENLLNANCYQLPYFRRLLIHTISFNWPKFGRLFWQLAGPEPVELFSQDVYKVELRELLLNISGHLSGDDVDRLQQIIAVGPVGDKHYTASQAAWQLRWLDALKNHPAFAASYEATRKLFPKVKDFSNDGRIRVRVGHVSPFSADELLDMPVAKLVTQLHDFKTVDRWEDPTVEGLGDNLRQAIEEKPERFIPALGEFRKVNYYYAYCILRGLEAAARKGKELKWDPILRFCLKYLGDPAFQDGTFFCEDEPRASKEWVYGVTGNLISQATKDGQPDFDEDCLELAKSVIRLILPELQPTDEARIIILTDYVTYSLNSTQGQVLRALLDASLAEGRYLQDRQQAVVWDPNLKAGFTATLTSGIIDGYILEGMYLQQFMFLDNAWLRGQIVTHQTAEAGLWAAFMGGIAFGKPISGDYYPIMKPHYERAVASGVIDTTHQSGLLRHFLAFYFWDYEERFGDTYLYRLIVNADLEQLTKLVQIVVQQRDAVNELKGREYERLSEKIKVIWLTILDRAETIELKKPSDLQQLLSFLDFIQPDELDERATRLILQTIQLTKDRGSHFLFQDIERLAVIPAAAPFLAQILAAVNLAYCYDHEQLIKILTFLYEQGQQRATNEIVNRLTLKGMDFLRPLYDKYNS